MFGNRVLRRNFGPNREEVAGGWRRLHSEEIHNLNDPPIIIIIVIKSRRMKWERYVARMRETRIAYRILVGKSEGKSPLERT
jgi:hypothetical protein